MSPHHVNGATPVAGVLVVDDEPTILTLLTRGLAHAGFTVFPAASGQQALEDLRVHWEAITVALIDLNMPDLDGLATAKEIRKIKPALPCSLISADLISQLESPIPGLVSIIGKPFVLSEVVTVLRKLHEQALSACSIRP